MNQKRFKHQAYVLCQMFCGWELDDDYARLWDLGKGKLEIDILTRECLLNGSPSEPLTVAGVLQNWLYEDMEAHGISRELVDQATLEIKFEVSNSPESEEGEGGAIQHKFHCTGKIRSGEDIFLVQFKDVAGAETDDS